MKSLLKIFSIFTAFILSLFYFAHAQTDLGKYEMGLSAGVFVYQGDLTPQTVGSYKTIKPQLALHISRILSQSFSVRININRGKLYGNDGVYSNPQWRKQRNFNFSSSVTEISAQAVWSFLAYESPQFSPYILAGAGFSFLKIKRDWSNINTAVFGEGSDVQNGLTLDEAKTLPGIIAVLPVGAGLRYYLSDRFSLIGETSYRLSFTDYLDGFSKAANPAKNDHYLSHSIGVICSFGKKDKKLGCPAVN